MLALRQIQKDVAQALDWEIGKIDLIVISAHIYKRDFIRVKEILTDVYK